MLRFSQWPSTSSGAAFALSVLARLPHRIKREKNRLEMPRDLLLCSRSVEDKFQIQNNNKLVAKVHGFLLRVNIALFFRYIDPAAIG